jgi:hypothetical protein
MAGRALEGIEIDALVFEPGMSLQMPAVATVAGGELLFLVRHGIDFCMGRVAGRTIDISPVVRAADEPDDLGGDAWLGVTTEAGLQLFLARRGVGAAPKLGQGREPAATVGP